MRKAFIIGSFSLFGLVMTLVVVGAATEARALSSAEACQAARATVFDRMPQPFEWLGNCVSGEGHEITQRGAEWTIQGQAQTSQGLKTWRATVLDMGEKRHLTTVVEIH